MGWLMSQRGSVCDGVGVVTGAAVVLLRASDVALLLLSFCLHPRLPITPPAVPTLIATISTALPFPPVIARSSAVTLSFLLTLSSPPPARCA